MPRKEGTKHLQVYMNEAAIEVVTAHAKERGYEIMADYLRDLIKQDMESHGKIVDFGIERGGWRGGGKDDE